MENTNKNVEELFKPSLSHRSTRINFKSLYTGWIMLMQIIELRY